MSEKPPSPDEGTILLLGAAILDLVVSLIMAAHGALGSAYSFVGSATVLMLGFFFPALMAMMLLIVVLQALVGAVHPPLSFAVPIEPQVVQPTLPRQQRLLDQRQRALDERALALDLRQAELLRREGGVGARTRPSDPEVLSANGLILYPGHEDRGAQGAGTAASQKLDYRIRRNSCAS